MENKQVSIEILLNEYNKYIMSRLINKDYDFNQLRQMVKEFSENTETLQYSDEMSNQEVAQNVSKFIKESTKDSYKFEI